jgi:prepilin-type N-terminal cleavage/methylation domain-containing protein
MNPTLELSPLTGARRTAARKGFTLVEVMVATVLLSMIILGILQVLIGSYRVAAKARYQDHARYVVKSMADEFLTQDPFDHAAGGTIFPMFQPTVDNAGNAAPLGTGMVWTNSDGTPGVTSNPGDPFAQYFYVKLGDTSGAPITATVTRQVWYVYAATGQPTLINTNAPGGWMLRADFVITYSYLGVQMPPMTMTAVRAIP